VDLAVILQAAGAVAPVIGIARHGVAEGQQRDAAAFADRAVPPADAALGDEPLELAARNDALIGRPPSVVVRVGDRFRVGRPRTSNLDEDCAHDSNRAMSESGIKRGVDRPTWCGLFRYSAGESIVALEEFMRGRAWLSAVSRAGCGVTACALF